MPKMKILEPMSMETFYDYQSRLENEKEQKRFSDLGCKPGKDTNLDEESKKLSGMLDFNFNSSSPQTPPETDTKEKQDFENAVTSKHRKTVDFNEEATGRM